MAKIHVEFVCTEKETLDKRLKEAEQKGFERGVQKAQNGMLKDAARTLKNHCASQYCDECVFYDEFCTINYPHSWN